MSSDLNLVSNDALIAELASRHDELIVIRDKPKGDNIDNMFIKTKFGVLGNIDLGYDLMEALMMLQAANVRLTRDYLEAMMV